MAENEGHFKRENPWITVEDPTIPALAELVGAKPIEVAPMNSLTLDVHVMMVIKSNDVRKIIYNSPAIISFTFIGLLPQDIKS